ncbi:unnamed protein product [Orchesella dallaii]|uniref:L-Fucosyltransferase n=1 Tax=Orchesella dallaii TaxID=48710 RepID=A0ABP1S6G7_9HEXA
MLAVFLILIKISYLSKNLKTTTHYLSTLSNFECMEQQNCSQLEPLPSPKSGNFTFKDIFGWGLPFQKTFYNTTLSPPGVILEINSVSGIGNQLFVYACSYALAKRKNWPLYIHFPKQNLAFRQFQPNQREFVLDKFTIPLDNIIQLGVTQFPPGQSQLWLSDEDLLERKYNKTSNQFMQLDYSSCCQSELYWKEYEQDIHRLFQVRTDSLNLTRIQKPLKEITSTESVAVHVRRGDFVRDESYTFPTQFHMKAVHLMVEMLRRERNVENPVFFVFTDDTTYAKRKFKEFSKIYQFVFVSEGNNTSVEDFFLMCLCKHIIFPNSTFSWWAAVLNKNKKKLVITSAFNPQYFKIWNSNNKAKEFYKMSYGTFYHRKEWTVIDPFSGGLVT